MTDSEHARTDRLLCNAYEDGEFAPSSVPIWRKGTGELTHDGYASGVLVP